MARNSFGVCCSPFILAATIRFHLKKYEKDKPDCFKMLNTSLYIDDLVHGADKLEDAYRLSADAVSIFEEAGMNMRKLKSNSVELNQLWVKDGIKKNDDLESESKVLGMIWYPNSDKIKLNFESIKNSIENCANHTKRTVLRNIAKLYDPVGFISPFSVRIKILLQNIWLR